MAHKPWSLSQSNSLNCIIQWPIFYIPSLYNISDTLGYRLVCHVVCSYYIFTSSVIYYWTDARQHRIYLLINAILCCPSRSYYTYRRCINYRWMVRLSLPRRTDRKTLPIADHGCMILHNYTDCLHTAVGWKGTIQTLNRTRAWYIHGRSSGKI